MGGGTFAGGWRPQDVLTEPGSRGMIAVGVVCSLVLGAATFGIWTLSGSGFADDSYLWWTLAAFLLPIAAALGSALLGRRRPDAAPAVAVAMVMLGVAFLMALLG